MYGDKQEYVFTTLCYDVTKKQRTRIDGSKLGDIFCRMVSRSHPKRLQQATGAVRDNCITGGPHLQQTKEVRCIRQSTCGRPVAEQCNARHMCFFKQR